MARYEVPLTPALPQRFTIALGNVSYELLVVWREGSGWVLDLGIPGAPALVCGIPLVTGADLLGQFGYLKIGGQLFVETEGDQDAIPTYENLGANGKVYFQTA